MFDAMRPTEQEAAPLQICVVLIMFEFQSSFSRFPNLNPKSDVLTIVTYTLHLFKVILKLPTKSFDFGLSEPLLL